MDFLLTEWVLFPSLLGYSLHFTTVSGGNVEVIDEAPCWEGRSHTLCCKLKNLSSSIEWKYENEVQPIAQCSEGSCDIDPFYSELYNISYDLPKHVFNLTIINVRKNANGTKLVCSDGTSSDCDVLTIGDNTPVVHEDTENRIIRMTSACSSVDTKVSFKVMKIDAMNDTETELIPKQQSTTVSPCLNECGSKQHIRYIENFSAEQNGNERRKYKVEVFYGNLSSWSIISTCQTIIEYQDTTSEERGSELHTMIYGLLGLLCLALIVAAILIVKHKPSYEKLRARKHKDKKEKEGNKPWTGLAEQGEAKGLNQKVDGDNKNDNNTENIVVKGFEVSYQDEETKDDDELVETPDDIEEKENVESNIS